MDTLNAACISPLVLADRLLGLAQAADRAGYMQCAVRILEAALAMLNDHVSEHVPAIARDANEASRLRVDARLN